MVKRSSPLLVAPLLLLASGCGGGGASSVVDTTPVQAGSVSAQGTNLTTVAATGDSTVYAITGAITKATYIDQSPTLDETEIIIGEDKNRTWQIVAMAPDGSDRRLITNNPIWPPSRIEVNSACTWIYYRANGPAGGELYRVPYGGGTPTQIIADCDDFDLSPDGNTIVYRKNTHDGWWRAVADGTSNTLIQPSTTYPTIWGFVNNTVFRVGSPFFPVSYAEYVVSNGGGVAFGGTAGVSIPRARMTTDGLPLWGMLDDGNIWLVRNHRLGFNDSDLALKVTSSDIVNSYDLSPSPDGSEVVLATNARGRTVNITDGTSNTVQIEEAADIHAVAWGNYIRRKVFVGEGKYASGAGALIFSETGLRLPCAVLVDATTRSSVVVTEVSSGGQNTVLKLTCDNLTKADRTLGRNYGYSTILSGGSGIKGAFISFDKATGELSSFTTFATAPSVSSTAQGVVLEGGEILQHFRKDDTLNQPQRVVL